LRDSLSVVSRRAVTAPDAQGQLTPHDPRNNYSVELRTTLRSGSEPSVGAVATGSRLATRDTAARDYSNGLAVTDTDHLLTLRAANSRQSHRRKTDGAIGTDCARRSRSQPASASHGELCHGSVDRRFPTQAEEKRCRTRYAARVGHWECGGRSSTSSCALWQGAVSDNHVPGRRFALHAFPRF